MNRYIVDTDTRRVGYLGDVLRVLVARDFKIRYKRSVLGIGWSLLVPLAQLAVFQLVFTVMVPLNIPHYTIFLFTGMLPWTWLQTSLMLGASTVVDNRELVRQAGFPVALLPLVTIISQLLHFLLTLPILAVFLVLDGFTAGFSLAALPLVILVQFILILSIAYFVGTLQVKFRDTQYLLGIALFLFFYLTPVFWDDSKMPEPFKSIMQLNPAGVLLKAYRAILTHGQWPDALPMLAVAGGSILVLICGYSFYARTCNRFVEEL